MIVLDEQIGSPELARDIAAWYPGRVAVLKELRHNSVIKDDGADVLLRSARNATFVTINVKDFWNVIRPDSRFGVVAISLPLNRSNEISDWLRRFLNLAEFNSKAKRMGVVVLLRPTRLEFYRSDRKVQVMDW